MEQVWSMQGHESEVVNEVEVVSCPPYPPLHLGVAIPARVRIFQPQYSGRCFMETHDFLVNPVDFGEIPGVGTLMFEVLDIS